MASINEFLVTFLEEQVALLKQQIVRAKALKSATGSSEKEEKTKKEPVDPNKPKNPLSAYQLYFMETLQPLKQANPGLGTKEAMV